VSTALRADYAAITVRLFLRRRKPKLDSRRPGAMSGRRRSTKALSTIGGLAAPPTVCGSLERFLTDIQPGDVVSHQLASTQDVQDQDHQRHDEQQVVLRRYRD
jgi:hypothetical protein